MKKQIIVIAIIAILVVVMMFAGCAEKEASETAQTVEQMPTPTPTPEPTLALEKPTANFGNSGV